MTKNIADNERAFRILAGGLIASMAFWGPQSSAFLLGIIPVITGIVGICPLYYALGFSSLDQHHDDQPRRYQRRNYH